MNRKLITYSLTAGVIIGVIAAVLILGETMTLVSGLGSAMILGGVILAGVKKRTEQTKTINDENNL